MLKCDRYLKMIEMAGKNDTERSIA